MADEGGMPGERLDEPGSLGGVEGDLAVERLEDLVNTEGTVDLDPADAREGADAGDGAGDGGGAGADAGYGADIAASGPGTGEPSTSADESRDTARPTPGSADVDDASRRPMEAQPPMLHAAVVHAGGEPISDHGRAESSEGRAESSEGQLGSEAGESRQAPEDAWASAPEPGPLGGDLVGEPEAAASGSVADPKGGTDAPPAGGALSQATDEVVIHLGGEQDSTDEAEQLAADDVEQLRPDEDAQPGPDGDERPASVENAQPGGDVDAQPGSGEPGAAEIVVEPAGKGRGSPRVEQLEREGEVAADFLERLLDIADLDGDIDVDVDGDRAAVAVVDSDEGRVPRRLVGPEGRVLEALQELTRLAVQTATGERSRLMLDVAGFRAERRSSLLQLARAAIAEVRDSGQQKALPDMTAFERKVVHDEVTAAGLVSESEGAEPHRHIVIMPV